MRSPFRWLAGALAALAAHLPIVQVHAEPQHRPRPTGLVTAVTLADIGFAAGFRFSNLGGRREIFIPLPQGADIAATELVLVLDDMSAHEARRSLEVMLNDRSVAVMGLDGQSTGRIVRVPLRTKPRDGFLKLAFLYSGAATQDRCIDVRSIGDSLTIRPESAVEVEIPSPTSLDIATTVALMPRDVSVVLPDRRLAPSDLAAALIIGRALKSSGRRVAFLQGIDAVAEVTRRDDPRRWSRGLVLIGLAHEYASVLEAPLTVLAGAMPALGTIAAVRSGGLPALLVSDVAPARAAQFLGSPSLAATRSIPATSVGEVAAPKLPADRVTFDDLGLAPAVAEVYGRAELTIALATKSLPAGTQAARLVLEMMVAPDGAGEKAVVSAFVNERLLGSSVAATGDITRLDLALPDGLVGTALNLRVVVQRRSAQGDCRFEPQGYPAQILGSTAIVLDKAGKGADDFADLESHWANGVEILLPGAVADRPAPQLGLIAGVLAILSPETAPLTVRIGTSGNDLAPNGPFLAVSNLPPAGATPRVRFDRGRVAVKDRAGRTLLDLAGYGNGAVAQIVTASGHPGLWIKPLAADLSLPAPAALRLDRGDVAFVDGSGVALALATDRDTLIRIAYPDQVSWGTIAERFRSWIIGTLWVLVTLGFLLVLQRIFRRRPQSAE